ncbi:MAG: hypothetical protein OQK74_02615, partial [Gammaproteobacteria bacterium]|nr:hypothetical protein [Gammaproteobacteria bacterium]
MAQESASASEKRIDAILVEMTVEEKVDLLAGVDFFANEAGEADPKIGVIGWGEGGMLALCAGALDGRIDAVATSGYFEP